jgi:uncharacterized cupredoxin-like copper-binding protein
MRLPLPARALAGLGAVLAAVGGLGIVAAGGGSADETEATILGPGRDSVALGIEHSRFSDDRIVVRRGTTLTFVVDNGDPIGHELIVGPPEVHARHESGTEAAHPPVPGEVTAPALASVSTTYTFDEVGTVTFACHLPGHVAFGMIGEVVVVDG